jgi:flagellar basal body-associated protein FliL
MKKKDMLLIGIGIGAALAAAAVIFFFWKKNDDEKPPKNAPQVPIHNPGEQSEFTTSASESEIG